MKENLHTAIAKRLRARRKQLDWTLRYVAEKSGIGTMHYNNLEKGKTDVRVSTLLKVLAAMGLEIHFDNTRGFRATKETARPIQVWRAK